MGRQPDYDTPDLSATEPGDLEVVTEEDLEGDLLAESIELVGASRHGEASGSEGRLEETPVPEVLHRLYAESATGALLLTRGAVKKVLYLRDGYPVAVKSNVTAECLGKILSWEGLIDRDQYRASLLAMRESGIRQGSALIRMGALTHRDLARGLELQLRFKLCETFGWSHGSSRFWPDVPAPFEAAPPSLAPASLIHEGVRSFMSHARVLAALRPSAGRYLHPSTDPLLRFQGLEVPDDGGQLLARIDGSETVGALMRVSDAGVKETAALLYTLLCTGMVDARAERAPRPRPLRDPTLEPEPPTDRSDASSPAVRVDLARLVGRLRASSTFEVLGVEPGADEAEILRAYETRCLERHPDRLAAATGGGIRDLAATALALTVEAFAALSGDGEPMRPAYEATTSREAIDERVRTIVEAEGHHQQGLELLDRGRFAEAIPALTRAVAACDEEGDFHATLAWAVFQAGLDAPAAEQALEHLEQAVARSPALLRAHVYRGHVLRFLDRLEEASHAFEEALRRDPDNEEAASELARIREAWLGQGEAG